VAIVKINFISTKREKRVAAKAHVRYIQHRSGKDGAKTHRQLFGSYGPMERWHAYAIIDQFDQKSGYFRIVFSPDPDKEDPWKDLLLPEITAAMMDLEDRLGKPIAWVAAVHNDHTEKRHVHVLAIADVRLLPAVEMRKTATEMCLEQRRERDLAREATNTRERLQDTQRERTRERK
jgi:hypothetical protein